MAPACCRPVKVDPVKIFGRLFLHAREKKGKETGAELAVLCVTWKQLNHHQPTSFSFTLHRGHTQCFHRRWRMKSARANSRSSWGCRVAQPVDNFCCSSLFVRFRCNTSTVAHKRGDLYRMQPHEVAHGHLVVVQGPHEGPHRAHAPAVGLNLGVSFDVAQPPPHRRAIDPRLHLV